VAARSRPAMSSRRPVRSAAHRRPSRRRSGSTCSRWDRMATFTGPESLGGDARLSLAQPAAANGPRTQDIFARDFSSVLSCSSHVTPHAQGELRSAPPLTLTLTLTLVFVWSPACPGCAGGAEADHSVGVPWGGRMFCLRAGSAHSHLWAGRWPDGSARMRTFAWCAANRASNVRTRCDPDCSGQSTPVLVPGRESAWLARGRRLRR